MQTLIMLYHGFSVSLTLQNLLACTIGVLVGTLTGILPGLGSTSAMALLLPISFGMDPTTALIMLAGIFYGAMYGGSTTSVLVNLPGESSSVITCIDGYAMAKKGRAGAALAVAAIGSFVAGTMGLIGLTLFAPSLSKIALDFGPPEYFAIAVLGLLILTSLTGTSTLKSILMVLVGIMLGTMGLDPLSGINRFTFNIDKLQRGIGFIVLAMGVFGLGEVMSVISDKAKEITLQKVRFRELYPNRNELKRSIKPMFRGGLVGFLCGLIPGPAAVISTFFSYAVEKRLSKHPEEFGKGAVEGVAGPESANNAATAGAMVPLLSLGLPFAPPVAILLSGFLIHGITPGPSLINEHPSVFWGLIASMYIGNVLLLIINLPLVGVFASLLKLPIQIFMPVIAAITFTGAYAVNNSIFDLWLLIIFGVLGYFMRQTEYEPAPLVLGLILGPTIERSLTQSLIMGDGNFLYFFTRPISGTMLGLGVLILVLKVIKWVVVRIKNNNKEVVSNGF